MKKYERCFVRIVKVDETLGRLGVTFEYTRCMKLAILMNICWLVMILLQNSIDVLWFVHKMTPRMAIAIVSIIHHPTHINAMVSLRYCLMMRYKIYTKSGRKDFQLILNFFMTNLHFQCKSLMVQSRFDKIVDILSNFRAES